MKIFINGIEQDATLSEGFLKVVRDGIQQDLPLTAQAVHHLETGGTVNLNGTWYSRTYAIGHLSEPDRLLAHLKAFRAGQLDDYSHCIAAQLSKLRWQSCLQLYVDLLELTGEYAYIPFYRGCLHEREEAYARERDKRDNPARVAWVDALLERPELVHQAWASIIRGGRNAH